MAVVRRGARPIGPAGRAREIPALLFAAIWLLGFEVAPAIHLARHAALPDHAHCHDGVCQDDGAERAPGAAATGERQERPSGDHGEGSVEHRGLAALAPACAILAIGGAPVAEILPRTLDAAHRDAAPRARARARAPPV